MNLEPETRRGYFISAEMKKIWAVEIELLVKLLEVCNKYNLKIWAEGGTLLGAVREGGFIPWDDDIDVAMLRDDYDKLLNISQTEFTSPYFFQSGYSDEFPCGFSKLRKDGTAAILPSEIYKSFHQGIFIDIFCYDAIAEDETIFLSQKKEALFKLRELKMYCQSYFSISNPKHNIKWLKARRRIKQKGFAESFKEYEDIFRKVRIQDNKYISFIAFFYDLEKFKRNKEWYNGTLFFPFEDITIPIPIGYDAILTKQYGDYMRPAKVRTMHGSFEVLNADYSYDTFLPSLRRKHRWDSWKERFRLIREKLG